MLLPSRKGNAVIVSFFLYLIFLFDLSQTVMQSFIGLDNRPKLLPSSRLIRFRFITILSKAIEEHSVFLSSFFNSQAMSKPGAISIKSQ
jgi:hypothetical protein